MALVSVLKHVFKHWSHITSISYPFKNHYLVKDRAQPCHNHLELDRDCELLLKSLIRQILLEWCEVIICYTCGDL